MRICNDARTNTRHDFTSRLWVRVYLPYVTVAHIDTGVHPFLLVTQLFGKLHLHVTRS